MKVKELLERLEGVDPEYEVNVWCNGGEYGSCIDGTDDLNEDVMDGDETGVFYISAATTQVFELNDEEI